MIPRNLHAEGSTAGVSKEVALTLVELQLTVQCSEVLEQDGRLDWLHPVSVGAVV